MPARHFIHVVGFEVPVEGAGPDEPLTVLLDKTPTEQWRAVFQLCVEELAPGATREPPQLLAQEIRVLPAGAITRALASDIRSFVDKVNRMTFMRGTRDRGAA
ncbi:hypothetical protein HH297_01705 [Xanthomonas sp. Kuri4-3]